MTEIGTMTTKKPIDNAMREIRDWLERIGVGGMTLDTKYDAKQNIALVRFAYAGKNYEFVSTTQANCRLNMHAIARVMEFKVRAHLMNIEPFEKSMKAYLQLGASDDALRQGMNERPTMQEQDVRSYASLGISPLASNDEIKTHYKRMCKAWHPDMAGSEEAKKEFARRFSELQTAYEAIKQERGIP